MSSKEIKTKLHFIVSLTNNNGTPAPGQGPATRQGTGQQGAVQGAIAKASAGGPPGAPTVTQGTQSGQHLTVGAQENGQPPDPQARGGGGPPAGNLAIFYTCQLPAARGRVVTPFAAKGPPGR